MATVYSLVCFGGLSGKTVTFTDAGDVVNLANHGLHQGVTGVVFSTTGTLPVGLTAGETCYTRDGADTGKFTIYPTKIDAIAGTNQITFTGTGSGTHTIKSANMLGLSSAQLARYGDSGSERIYNGLAAWETARNYLQVLGDVEHCEILDSFTIYISTPISCVSMYKADSVIIETKVNGARTEGFHNGDVTAGFLVIYTGSSAVFNPNTSNMIVDGLRMLATYNGGVRIVNPGSLQFNTIIKNCILRGNPLATTQLGMLVSDAVKYSRNIIFEVGGVGVSADTGRGSTVCNNIVTKCKKGFDAPVGSQGLYANNVSTGNDVNYEDSPRYASTKLFNNVGESIDGDKVAFTASAGSQTLTFASAHYRGIDAVVVFDSTGTLPTVGGVALEKGFPYIVRTTATSTTMTIANNNGATAFTFDGVGTGEHTMTRVWCSALPLLVDMTTPSNIFVDYVNNDFRLASGSPLIDAGMDLSGVVESVDMFGAICPNYEASTYPNNYWDVGPFEYDHGDGLVPIAATLTIAANVSLSGSEIRIYDADNTPTGTLGTELSGTESNPSTTYVYSAASLLTNTIYIQVMQSGYEEFLTSHTVTNINETLTLTLKADVNA